MCFDVKTKVKIAEKDIVCYKLIRSNGFPAHNNLYVNGRKEPFKVGYHYTENYFSKHGTRGGHIYGYAFHSFINRVELRKMYSSSHYKTGWKTIKCVIPKGTYYYENNTQYCSSDIIYVKDILTPQKRKSNAKIKKT